MTITVSPLLVSGLALLAACAIGFVAGVGVCLWIASTPLEMRKEHES